MAHHTIRFHLSVLWPQAVLLGMRCCEHISVVEFSMKRLRNVSSVGLQIAPSWVCSTYLCALVCPSRGFNEGKSALCFLLFC